MCMETAQHDHNVVDWVVKPQSIHLLQGMDIILLVTGKLNSPGLLQEPLKTFNVMDNERLFQND